MITYDFGNFPYVDSFVEIPTGTVFYRGVPEGMSDKDILRDYPMYLAPREIAKLYGNIKCLQSTASLKLIDVRRLIGLLRYILTTVNTMNKEIHKGVAFLSIAFGLISYFGQVNALETLYQSSTNPLAKDKIALMKAGIKKLPPHPIEQLGVRTGDSTINGFCVVILKELLSRYCDGYIAPRLESTYEKCGFIHEEIVIFDPLNKLVLIDTKEFDIKDISTIFVGPSVTLQTKRLVGADTLLQRAGAGIKHDDFNTFFDNKKKVYQAVKLSKKFADQFNPHIYNHIIFTQPDFNRFFNEDWVDLQNP